MKKLLTVLFMCGAVVASACSSDKDGPKTTQAEPISATGSKENKNGGLFEAMFGGGGTGSQGGNAVAVNGYLWRASLDTISFLPVNTADPFGGIIITEWYTPPEAPDERFKVNIYILDKALRADGLRVTVFRQRRTPDGQWVEARVNQKTSTDLENAILKRARQMRVRLSQ
jgi:hypothetical protein